MYRLLPKATTLLSTCFVTASLLRTAFHDQKRWQKECIIHGVVATANVTTMAFIFLYTLQVLQCNDKTSRIAQTPCFLMSRAILAISGILGGPDYLIPCFVSLQLHSVAFRKCETTCPLAGVRSK